MLFSSVKDAVLFSVNVLDCETLKCCLGKNNRGISQRKIGEIIDTIYMLVISGIYYEKCAGLKPGEPIVFGAMIDTGSKVKKTKEYAGICIKYFLSDGVAGGIVRTIGFRIFVNVTAENVNISTIQTFFNWLYNKIHTFMHKL